MNSYTVIEMSDEARNAARSLAVSYDAYMDAMREVRRESNPKTRNSAVVWARALRDAQRRTAVELVDPALLEYDIAENDRDCAA